ncbi:hypothetical protein ROLI_013060 [Roseobacter fucihabitans]|uniref:Uncharacterized protein n=1 Tax=Roseobacter fucihabitans TaxID=1537242 RepID=A0ABZ2BQL0_9RHOB|nr:hypothetical protein [Roseobacter litoralis]MBC6964167.1 hypothetical protein [Roseobacter litoralis]
MTSARQSRDTALTAAFDQTLAKHKKTPAKPSPVTLRVTPEERTKLEELAAGMTLSAYIRACVFAEETKRRKKRPANVIEDKKAAAEALALLGQSRIASNLNQLAYHANIGALIVGGHRRDAGVQSEGKTDGGRRALPEPRETVCFC